MLCSSQRSSGVVTVTYGVGGFSVQRKSRQDLIIMFHNYSHSSLKKSITTVPVQI